MKELEKLTEKVFKLYARYGIKSITMDDVAREMCMSKKTLYTMLKDKEDLVNKVADYKIKLLSEMAEQMIRESDNAIEEMVNVYKILLSFLKQHNHSMIYDLKKYYPAVFQKIQKARRKNIFNGISKNLKKGQKQGFYRKDFDPELIAKLHIIRMESLEQSDLITIEDFQSEDRFNDIFKYHLFGVATPKGIGYFEKKIKEIKPE